MSDTLLEFVLAQGKTPQHSETTLLETLSESPTTTLFATALKRYPALVSLLSSSSTPRTIFAPTNRALEAGGYSSAADLDDATLRYHILSEAIPLSRIIAIGLSSAPTLLEPASLNGPQRLTVAVDPAGLTVNATAHATSFDKFTSTGVIHTLDRVLAPPPSRITTITSLLPAERFSKLRLAFSRTALEPEITRSGIGSTVFTPTDKAFAELGAPVNYFLFEDEAGLPFLKALLRYHVIPKITLYTNAFYPPLQQDEEKEAEKTAGTTAGAEPVLAAPPKLEDKCKPTFPRGRRQWELRTLLADELLTVTAFRYGTLIALQSANVVEFPAVNTITSDGVIHPLNRILLPPGLLAVANRKRELSVEQLKAGLEKYI